MTASRKRIIVANDDDSLHSEITGLLKGQGYELIRIDDLDEAQDKILSGAADFLFLNFDTGSKTNLKSGGSVFLQYLQLRKISIPTVVVSRQTAPVHSLVAGLDFVRRVIDRDILHVSLRMICEAFEQPLSSGEVSFPKNLGNNRNGEHPEIFIIHGREHRHRKRVVGLLESLGVRPTYLEGEPLNGQVIIESIEKHAEQSVFAISLFSGDDVGRLSSQARGLRKRARQNVVFETGIFIGKLSRRRVVILREDDVEVPSDLHGVLTLNLSADDATLKLRLIQEFQAAGVSLQIRA